MSYAQTKLEHLLEPLQVPENQEASNELFEVNEISVIDTLAAHADLIKRRGELKAQMQSINDQVSNQNFSWFKKKYNCIVELTKHNSQENDF